MSTLAHLPRTRSRRERRRGITLVELMVVIVILGLMAGAVTIAFVPQLKKSKRDLAWTEMVTIGEACEMFEIQVGRPPESLDELKNPPDGYDSFLKRGDFKDPWGFEYDYSPTDEGVQIISLGRDGSEGGTGESEDLIYPKPEE